MGRKFRGLRCFNVSAARRFYGIMKMTWAANFEGCVALMCLRPADYYKFVEMTWAAGLLWCWLCCEAVLGRNRPGAAFFCHWISGSSAARIKV